MVNLHAHHAREAYEALLFEYAAGTLDQAHQLIIAAHLAFSPQARRFVGGCEAIGGAMMEKQCSPAAMNAGALKNVLTRLDQPKQDPCADKGDCGCLESISMPDLLTRSLAAQRRAPQWRRVYPGLRTFALELECKNSKARFFKIEPARRTPPHRHHGMELTLVLDGAFEDETGAYKRGDLAVSGDQSEHSPQACRNQGCVCLMVTSAPLQFKGAARVLNAFMKI